MVISKSVFASAFTLINGQASVLSADVCQGRSNFSGFEKLLRSNP
jgi:hypothetical protein